MLPAGLLARSVEQVAKSGISDLALANLAIGARDPNVLLLLRFPNCFSHDGYQVVVKLIIRHVPNVCRVFRFHRVSLCLLFIVLARWRCCQRVSVSHSDSAVEPCPGFSLVFLEVYVHTLVHNDELDDSVIH